MTPRSIFSNRLSHLVHANFWGKKNKGKFWRKNHIEERLYSGFHECEKFHCKSREGLWVLFDLPWPDPSLNLFLGTADDGELHGSGHWPYFSPWVCKSQVPSKGCHWFCQILNLAVEANQAKLTQVPHLYLSAGSELSVTLPCPLPPLGDHWTLLLHFGHGK